MADLTTWLPDPGSLPAGLPHEARLLLDAWEQFGRVAEAVPAPGQGGALGRLSAGATIVAHIASQQDLYWNSGARSLEPDAWLAALTPPKGEPPRVPRYDEACAALRRTEERALSYLLTLTFDELERVVFRHPSLGPLTVAALLDRAITHVFAHAGELSAVGSLVGAPDIGLPGRLRYSAAARQGRSSNE